MRLKRLDFGGMKDEKTNAIVSGRKADFFFYMGKHEAFLPTASLQDKARRPAALAHHHHHLPLPTQPSLLHNRILTSSYPKPTLLLLAGASSGWCCCGACSFKLHLGGILLRSDSEWVLLFWLADQEESSVSLVKRFGCREIDL